MFGDQEAGDIRCGSCGSLLYSVVRDGDFVHVLRGGLLRDVSAEAATGYVMKLLQSADGVVWPSH